MEKAANKRNKRSPSITAEVMAELVDKVWQHRDVLFGGTKGQKRHRIKEPNLAGHSPKYVPLKSLWPARLGCCEEKVAGVPKPN